MVALTCTVPYSASATVPVYCPSLNWAPALAAGVGLAGGAAGVGLAGSGVAAGAGLGDGIGGGSVGNTGAVAAGADDERRMVGSASVGAIAPSAGATLSGLLVRSCR